MWYGFMPFEVQAQPPGPGWSLTWEDHFNDLDQWRKRDVARKPRKGFNWCFEADNVSVNHGKLRLKVTKSGNTIYCAAVDTYGKFAQKYGYFEARMKIAPVARGIHSAFWMMAGNPNTKSGGVWSTGNQANDGAEIDVCETVRYPGTTFAAGAVHWDGYGSHHRTSKPSYPDSPGIHNDDYHIYGVLWEADKIEIYYDGTKVKTITNIDHIPDVAEWLLLSNGVNWGNTSPNGSFPVTTYVDWVKVYKKSNSSSPGPG